MEPNPMRTVYRNYTPQAAAVHDADSDEEVRAPMIFLK